MDNILSAMNEELPSVVLRGWCEQEDIANFQKSARVKERRFEDESLVMSAQPLHDGWMESFAYAKKSCDDIFFRPFPDNLICIRSGQEIEG